jgi:hypothetical protein
MSAGPLLPALPLQQWEPSKNTLHLYCQIVGKIRLATTPAQNHWWNVTLRVNPRGLIAPGMRWQDTSFDLSFDLIDHALCVRADRGETDSFPLADGLTVADFYEQLFTMLAGLGIEVTIRPEPYGVPMKTPFPQDREHASYDREAVERFWHALVWIDWVFRQFAGWYCGKTSPVQLFWHSLDLAVSRFSGNRARVAANADASTREAYSHEVISFGFWAGDANVRMPAFYSYTAPEPPDLTNRALRPATASWSPVGSSSLALLPYDDVRTADDEQTTLLAFLQSAYDAGAGAAGWDTDALRSSACPAITP